MAENKFSRIQLRRGMKANLKLVNPMLKEGEPISEIDTGRLKIGDGINRYNSLKYVGGGSGGAPSIVSFIIKSAKTNTGDIYSSSLIPNGCTISELVLYYTISSNPDNIKITSSTDEYYNESYPEGLSGELKISNVSITEDKTFTVTLITDETTVTENVVLNFSPYYYYATIQSSTIPFLDSSRNDSDMGEYTKNLISSRSFTTENISCDPNEYIYILLPTIHFGSSQYVSFTDISNNFTGGFVLIGGSTTQIINKYGHADSFNVYRSMNHSLGTKSFKIS